MFAIDVHGHYGTHNPRGRTGLETKMRSASIEEVRERAQQVDICLTIVSPLQALHPYGGDVIRANEDAREKAERYDDIRFWAVLDPCRQPTFRQVEQLLGHPRCKGIKIHPVNHEYEIRDRGSAIFEFAAAHAALVLTHSGCPEVTPRTSCPSSSDTPKRPSSSPTWAIVPMVIWGARYTPFNMPQPIMSSSIPPP